MVHYRCLCLFTAAIFSLIIHEEDFGTLMTKVTIVNKQFHQNTDMDTHVRRRSLSCLQNTLKNYQISFSYCKKNIPVLPFHLAIHNSQGVPCAALPSSTTPAAYICQARSVHAFPTFPASRHSPIVAMLEGRRGDLAQQFSLPALTRTHERESRFALTLGLIL